MGTLPDFTEDGLLPTGDHAMTLEELRDSMLVKSPGANHPNWDESWRLHLVNNLEILARQLWQVGVKEIFVNGSFVEDKDHPNDIDGYFVCERQELASGQLQEKLNLLDPFKIWTWAPSSRMPYRGSPKKQLPMWHKYRVELYPHCGQLSGLRDRFGNPLEFPSAFRICRRSNQPKGIIRLKEVNDDPQRERVQGRDSSLAGGTSAAGGS